MSTHPRELLSAYLDAELPPPQSAQLEQHLRGCTECTRELAIMQQLGGAMRSLPSPEPPRSVWDGVHRRITRPVGWILFLAGLAIWAALALVAWLRQALTLEWVAATGIGVGVLLLLIGIAWEQYSEWKVTRYKDVQR